jgi:acyl dehydratase
VPIDRTSIGRQYAAPDYVATAERIAAFAKATGESSARSLAGEVAPPVFAIVPAWPAVRAALADESAGIQVDRTVHGEQRMRLHRPIRAGDALHSAARLASIEDRGANEVFVLALATTGAEGDPVADQEVVVVSRGTAAHAEASKPRAPSSGGRQPAPEPPPPDIERTVELWPDITHRYASASGDDNRIHLDDDLARSVGLPGIIVQGLCLLSIALQPLVDVSGSQWIQEVAVRFARPIRPGQTLVIRIWHRADGFAFDALGPEGDVLRNGMVVVGDRAR